MRRLLASGYELDDDRDRVDIDYVFEFLSTQSYWARQRARVTVERSIAQASRAIGAYHGDAQVGFARVISDDAVFAHLADVFIDQAHRGRGLGIELVREAVDCGPHRDLRWTLKTGDAQGLYAKLGFVERSGGAMERSPRRAADRCGPSAPPRP